MEKKLKDHEVYTLPEKGQLRLTVSEGAEVWVECSREDVDLDLNVKLEPGAHLRYMTAHPGKARKKFLLEEGARLDYFHHVFGAAEEEVLVTLKGSESQVFSQTLFFGSKSEAQTLSVNHVHEGQHSRSHMVSRGAVKDKALSRFYGNIFMMPGCSGAQGRLEEHNLLLSNGARIEAVPALEVHHDEVLASHSATLERADEEKLFYLQSRGLSPEKALALLVEGFFWDPLQRAPNLAFSQRIFQTILACLRK